MDWLIWSPHLSFENIRNQRCNETSWVGTKFVVFCHEIMERMWCFLVCASREQEVDYSDGFLSAFFRYTWSDQKSSTKSSTKFYGVRLNLFLGFSHQRVPFSFLLFCDKVDVEYPKACPPFSFFGIVRLSNKILGAVGENTLTLESSLAIFDP